MLRYAETVDELTRPDMALLAEILHIDVSNEGTFSKAQYLIQNLPRHLRYQRISSLLRIPRIGSAKSNICPAHKGLNSRVIGHIFTLLRHEVGQHLKAIYKFTETIGRNEYFILEGLRAINGMWTDPSSKDQMLPPETWAFQTNKCEACMISRIALDTIAVQDLRSALLSRNRTRKPRPPPRLLPFLEELINQYPQPLRFQIYFNSGEAGYPLKDVRKAALKTRHRTQRENQNSVPKKLPDITLRRCSYSSVVPIYEYSDPSFYSERPHSSPPSTSCNKSINGDYQENADLLEIIDRYTSTYVAASGEKYFTSEQKAAAMNLGPQIDEDQHPYFNEEIDTYTPEESEWEDAEVGEEVPLILSRELRETTWDLFCNSFQDYGKI
jgi:hypothetical protein